jgi:hypothetical protein
MQSANFHFLPSTFSLPPQSHPKSLPTAEQGSDVLHAATSNLAGQYQGIDAARSKSWSCDR